ncbi:nucleotidyltransferase domain-containing protein [Candidatus Eisenbacteria bacterium]|uniref:Nucleotidyltransferase domain-containing protein n=1 Tax=Eiseniibacteriota bacterium TaxID=2212470 RepID=A0ABV6YMJ5_UNCEI
MGDNPDITPVRSSLERLFPSPTVLHVLSVLLLHPEREFYQSELAEASGSTLLQVQRAVHRIEEAGLVSTARRGNRVYYSAERSHPVFEELKRIALKTVGLGDSLRKALARHRDNVQIAFVFGSFASGAETVESDVDVLIVGDLTSRQTSRALGPVGREVGREFNPVVFPAKEFRQKARRGNRFIEELIASPKVWLIGTQDDLEALIG